MILPKTSAHINPEYSCNFSNPGPVRAKKVWGYKLVLDKGENFYSISTGMFRYKLGPIKRIEADYSIIYEETKFFSPDIVGKIAVFNDPFDVDILYPNRDKDLTCLLRIQIGGDLISIDAKNKHGECRVFAGNYIHFMERFEV